MWSAAVIAGCCVWIASAQNALTIENVRPTFGSPGPDRAGALQVYPGDTLFISFSLKGLQTNNQGQGKVRLEVEATDAAGSRVFRQDSGDSTFLNALGGDSFHTNVRLDMGPKTAPGKYKVKVIATDLTSKTNATRESDIEILPPGFAIVKVTAGTDQNLSASASVFGIGQALYVGFAVVGFQNEAATKHPNLRLEMKVKEGGVVLAGASQTGEVNATQVEKVPQGSSMVPGRFLLPLNKVGKFTVEVTATDLVTQKVAGPISFTFDVVSPK
jgi:hypothetical protein